MTLLQLPSSVTVSVKTKEKHGYNAVVMGVLSSARVNKPQAKFLEKFGIIGDFKLFESRVDCVDGISPGSFVGVNHFVVGQYVDVVGASLGKGFAGVMKRHNFHGLRASHGVSLAHRSQGSTGQCQDPGRVFKGKKMAGHLGNARTTVQNLKILSIDQSRSLLIVKGNNVPGFVGSLVYIRDAVKKSVPLNAPFIGLIDRCSGGESSGVADQVEAV